MWDTKGLPSAAASPRGDGARCRVRQTVSPSAGGQRVNIPRRSFMLALASMMVPVGMVADVWAESPAGQLRRQIDRVVHVLADPDLKAAGREPERQAAVSKIAEEIFDFAEITRRTLGPHWQGRTEPATSRDHRALLGSPGACLLHQDRGLQRRKDHGLRRRSGDGPHSHRHGAGDRDSGGLPDASPGRSMDGVRCRDRGRESRGELPHAVQQNHPVLVLSRARRQAQVQGGLTDSSP